MLVKNTSVGRGGRTDLGGVVCGPKDELRCPVVPRADVRDVGLILHQNLCAAKIAQLQYAGRRVQQQILRLDVSVADALRVDVGERAEKLIDVEFDLKNGHHRLHLVEIAGCAVYGLGYEFKHQVEIHFIFLRLVSRQQYTWDRRQGTYPFAIVVEESFELNDVGVSHDAHNLKFPILIMSALADTGTNRTLP
jgi:hypothetical protein